MTKGFLYKFFDDLFKRMQNGSQEERMVITVLVVALLTLIIGVIFYWWIKDIKDAGFRGLIKDPFFLIIVGLIIFLAAGTMVFR